MHSIEVDLAYRLVGVFDGGVEVVAGGGDAEDTTTRSLEAMEACAGTGLKDELAAGFDAGDDIAASNGARVAMGGQDDADRGITLPAEGLVVEEGREEIRIQAVEERLGFRVAEASVVFKNLGTGRGHHEAGVKEAGIGSSIVGHLRESWVNDRMHDGGGLLLGEDATVAVCAHASGVGSRVAIVNSLVVLRCVEGESGCAVGEYNEAHLLALKKFFNYDFPGGKLRKSVQRLWF